MSIGETRSVICWLLLKLGQEHIGPSSTILFLDMFTNIHNKKFFKTHLYVKFKHKPQ